MSWAMSSVERWRLWEKVVMRRGYPLVPKSACELNGGDGRVDPCAEGV